MPSDGEGAGGQGIHHIWTHQSSCSSRDTKLCSVRGAARPQRWGEMKAAVCIHIPLQCIVKQYIITPAFSGHFCSHMIKSSINIPQWMFHFTPFNSIPSVAVHISSARQVKSGEPLIRHIVRHTDISTHMPANPAEPHRMHTEYRASCLPEEQSTWFPLSNNLSRFSLVSVECPCCFRQTGKQQHFFLLHKAWVIQFTMRGWWMDPKRVIH